MLQHYGSQEKIPQQVRFLSLHARNFVHAGLKILDNAILCSGPDVCLVGWQNTKTRSGCMNSHKEEKGP